VFWEGEPLDGHNLLRRFVLAHHSPHPNGELLRGPLTTAHWGGMKTPDHLARIQTYREHGLEYDYYWIDAGWYGPPDSYSPDEFTGDWHLHVGNWNINPAAHPDGLRPISDAARGAGMRFLLWFEPERAVNGTPLTQEHPDWFLGTRAPGANLLFDLGNPEARAWLTDYLVGFMTEQGIRLYRQDFNFDPLPYWREADPPDRQGITEIRHIEGLYTFWDDLLRRVPGLVIDDCASGGRRIDLETVSRSIPLWRSDWQCRPDNDPIGGQNHGMGLSYWLPLHGTGTWGAVPQGPEGDLYRVRSAYGAALQFSVFPYAYTPIRDDYPWDWHRERLTEYRRVRPLFYGDYYPLLGGTPAADAWVAYQMHRTDLDQGMVMAFRRAESLFVTADLPLRALEPEATYELEDCDTGRVWQATAAQLTKQGLRVSMDQPRQSRLVLYRRLDTTDTPQA
jgi:alpha-galactosidase